MLSCTCDYDGSEGWYYYVPNDFTTLETSKRKRCCSCRELIDKKAVCLEFERARGPVTDIEEAIHGDTVEIASWWMCEPCGEIFLNLNDLGYCLEIGYVPMKEFLEEYHLMTGWEKEEGNTTSIP